MSYAYFNPSINYLYNDIANNIMIINRCHGDIVNVTKKTRFLHNISKYRDIKENAKKMGLVIRSSAMSANLL